MPEFDVFDAIYEQYGAPNDGEKITEVETAKYESRLPKRLLQFWREHGVGNWQQGRIWLCDPASIQPVINEIFAGDLTFDAKDFTVFAYDAFGSSILVWHPKHKTVFVNFIFGTVYTIPPENFMDDATGKLASDDFLIGSHLRLALRDQDSWVDNNGKSMFPKALKRLGPLSAGEIYGFVPALQIGGGNEAKYLQKLPLVEHLLFLVSLSQFKLIQHVDVPGTFGKIEEVRPIGRQE